MLKLGEAYLISWYGTNQLIVETITNILVDRLI